MAVSIIALIVTGLSVVLSTAMVMIAATWKLSQRIDRVDRRIDEVRTEIANGRTKEREWARTEMREQVAYHRETCRAAQDVVTGVRSNPLQGV